MNALNYLLVNGMCCCLNLCCKQLWQTLYKLVGKHAFIKFAYCLVYFSSVFLSIVFISVIADWSWFMEYLAPGIDCQSNQKSFMINCLSSSVVYRVCSALLILSCLMLCVITFCSTRVSLILNEGLFFSKFVIVMILTAIFLQVESSYFEWFGWVSQLFSYIFVAIQSMILIDLAYRWGISWARKYSRGSNFYAALLIVSSCAMFICTFYLIIDRFRAENHQYLKWADIICLLQVLIMIGVQLLNFNKQNSLLTTSALCILVAYCTWSSGNSHPSTIPINQDALYLNMGITFCLLIISTFGSIYGSSKAVDENGQKQEMIDLDNPPTEYNNLDLQQIEQVQRERGYWVQWILYLAGMSMYMAMIVTDWGSADIVQKKFNLTPEAWSSKLVMGGVVFVMYTWSLIAPRVCPQRNFYFE